MELTPIDRTRMISAFMNAGFNLLELQVSENKTEWWLADSFDESVFNSTASVDFCKVEGYDVTPFTETASGMFHNNTQFQNNLTNYIEKATSVHMKFSKYIRWRYYSSYKTRR